MTHNLPMTGLPMELPTLCIQMVIMNIIIHYPLCFNLNMTVVSFPKTLSSCFIMPLPRPGQGMHPLGMENCNHCGKYKEDEERSIELRCQCTALGTNVQTPGVEQHVVGPRGIAKHSIKLATKRIKLNMGESLMPL